MEIYTNSAESQRRVTLPFGATPTGTDVFIYKGDEQVFEFSEVGYANGELSVTIPLFLNQFDGDLSVHWSVSYLETANGENYTVNKSTPVHMVTPILSTSEIRAVWDDATDIEVVRIEKAVRHIIQAFTGQEFGFFVGEHTVKATGGPLLRLPRRLISLNTFNGATINDTHFQIGDGGYTLRHFPLGVPPVKADAYGLHMHTGGVIHNPNNVRWQEFNAGTYYTIAGNWGWEAVPEAVKEAAKLLVNDYACADSQYRDRYLVSMTAADWRIQFHSGAYLRTGNVRADQLLSEFVTTRGWGVI